MDTNVSGDTFFSDRYARRRFPPPFAWLGAAVIVFVIVMALLWLFVWRAPDIFPSGTYLAVQDGATLGEAATQLKKQDMIRSPFWFTAWSVVLGGQNGLKAGEYYFSTPLSVIELARRLTHGIQGITPVTVTIPEGLNDIKVAALISQSLPRINRERFVELAKQKEGYLFPDTYSFFPNVSEERVIEEMERNFAKRTASVEREIEIFGRPLKEVVIMASLIEGEARTEETRRKVSGILWKRLALGMPLQVDAVFPYIFGERPYDLTNGDLLVDSPYNTYTYVGLPPTAISNPGLAAIRAALTPIATPYWYYLSDKDGNMHYARTHEEHLVNRAKYLGR